MEGRGIGRRILLYPIKDDSGNIIGFEQSSFIKEGQYDDNGYGITGMGRKISLSGDYEIGWMIDSQLHGYAKLSTKTGKERVGLWYQDSPLRSEDS